MHKQIFKVFISTVLIMLLITLSSCSSYSSHYKAVGFVHTNTRKHASMNFVSFEGSMVFKLKCENDDEKISFSAHLETGSAKVFYDCNGTKTELFSIDSGCDINEIGGNLQKGTVYIIVEMTGTGQNGRFEFDIN